MFERHNKLTIASYILLAINGVAGALIAIFAVPEYLRNGNYLTYLAAGLLCIIPVLSGYLAYGIYKRSIKVLFFCVWLWALQVFRYENGFWTFSLRFGVDLSYIVPIGTGKLLINLWALMTFIVLFLAYRGVSNSKHAV